MLKRLLRVDDPCDVFGVHGVCGIVGCILTGVFAASSLGGVGFVDGVTMGHQVMVQLEVLLLRSSGPALSRLLVTNWRISLLDCVYRKSRSARGWM